MEVIVAKILSGKFLLNRYVQAVRIQKQNLHLWGLDCQ